jgi:hypothetical protein
LDPSLYGTHSLRRTKATLICERTGNLRAVRLLLGHTKIECTVRYLRIEVDDALEIDGLRLDRDANPGSLPDMRSKEPLEPVWLGINQRAGARK